MSNPPPPPDPPIVRQVVKISPALQEWIMRAPSRRVRVHRHRYRPEVPKTEADSG